MTILLTTIIDSWSKVTIWGTFPVVFSFILIVGTIIIDVFQKDRINPINEIRSERKNNKVQDIYEKRDYCSEIVLGTVITLALIPIFMLLNIPLEGYIDKILGNISMLYEIVLGLTGIVFTMGVAVIVFDKKYYLLFSVKQVLQKRGFAESVVVVIGSCLITCGISITLLEKTLINWFDYLRFIILEIAVLYNIIATTRSLIICIDIMFSESKNELSLLNQLYQRFWVCRISTIHIKKGWKREAVEVNVRYLLEQYLEICRSKKVREIKHIEFGTTIGCNKKEQYNKLKLIMICILVCALIISVTVCELTLQENRKFFIAMNFITTAIVIIFTCLNIPSFQVAAFRLLSDTWGYYVFDKNNRIKFVPRVSVWTNNIYDKYFMRMNSLNSFFFIWLKDIQKNQGKIVDQFKIILDSIERLEEKNVIMYFPVFTIGFFLFQKKIEVEELKDIYVNYVNEEQKKAFHRMIHSQIFYLTIYIEEDLFGYSEELNKYLDWIE